MGSKLTRVSESERARYNEYMRKYYANPANAEKHRRLMAEYGSRPEVKARRARLARERHSGKASQETIAERTRLCERCGARFERNRRGRVRIYCEACVSKRIQPAKGPRAAARRS